MKSTRNNEIIGALVLVSLVIILFGVLLANAPTPQDLPQSDIPLEAQQNNYKWSLNK